MLMGDETKQISMTEPSNKNNLMVLVAPGQVFHCGKKSSQSCRSLHRLSDGHRHPTAAVPGPGCMWKLCVFQLPNHPGFVHTPKASNAFGERADARWDRRGWGHPETAAPLTLCQTVCWQRAAARQEGTANSPQRNSATGNTSNAIWGNAFSV